MEGDQSLETVQILYRFTQTGAAWEAAEKNLAPDPWNLWGVMPA